MWRFTVKHTRNKYICSMNLTNLMTLRTLHENIEWYDARFLCSSCTNRWTCCYYLKLNSCKTDRDEKLRKLDSQTLVKLALVAVYISIFLLLKIYTHYIAEERLNLFRQRRFRYFNVDRSEVSHAEVLPIERLREVVDIIDEKSSTVDNDRLADSKVDWWEILLHFLVGDLHAAQRKIGLNVVAVFRTAMSTHKRWKWILAVVVKTHFNQLHRVIAQVILHTQQNTRIQCRQDTTELNVCCYTSSRSSFSKNCVPVATIILGWSGVNIYLCWILPHLQCRFCVARNSLDADITLYFMTYFRAPISSIVSRVW